MFFILTKMVALLLKPLNILLITGLFALFSKRPRLKKMAIRATVALFLVFSNPWLISVLSGIWETGHRSPVDIAQPYDVGIVLGGYTESLTAAPPGVLTFSRSGNRLSTALLLYQRGKIRHLLLSGGSGRIIGTEQIEAQVGSQLQSIRINGTVLGGVIGLLLWGLGLLALQLPRLH